MTGGTCTGATMIPHRSSIDHVRVDDLTDGMALDNVHAAAACSASKQLHHVVKLHALLICLLCKAAISGSLFVNIRSLEQGVTLTHKPRILLDVRLSKFPA